jgi:signal transduction histidine kinase
MRAKPEHRGILAVDIQGFGRLDRSNPARARMRTGLHRILGNAMTAAGIDPDHVAQSEYGDGVVVLLDPRISKARLLHPLVPRLVSNLSRYNRTAPDTARLRLRVVVHAGELLRDDHGITGEDLILAFRLLDADVVRAHLTQAGTDLVLVVSDVIYQGIVKHGYGGIEPARFQPAWVSAKETSSRAWLHIPGTDQGIAPIPAAAPGIHPRTVGLPAGLPALPARTSPDRRMPGIAPLADRQLPGTLQIPASVYVEGYQPGGSWVRHGPQGLSMYGYANEENAPNFWKTKLHPADRDRVLAADEWCEQSLEPLRITYRVFARDGRAVLLRDESVVLWDETGAPCCWLGVNFHLTDHTTAELDANSRLEVLDQLRSTFLAAVSRGLHDPLNNILKTCRTLEQGRRHLSEGAASRLLRGVASSAGRLERLLTDVISLQRLDWGAVALDRRPFDIAGLVEQVAARWRVEGRWPQVSAPSTTVWLDPDTVERILHELLANVAKHTPLNTPVWVRTHRNGAGVLLVVEDAGQGLPKGLQLSAFERLPSSENIHSPAIGIGLSLVLRLAKLHGGTAWIEDRPGGGTSVSVLLPGPPSPIPYTGVGAALLH